MAFFPSTLNMGSLTSPLWRFSSTMKRLILSTMMVCATVAGLGAQQPGVPERGPMPGPAAMGRGGAGPVDDPAQFLLGHTAEFRLTDAQVTRLAAIARRSTERRRSLRAQMDSMRPARTPGTRPDSATRERSREQSRQRFEQMRPAMDRMRQQAQADRRDAIAVLTPDQQAQAWERIAAVGRGQRDGMRGSRGPRSGRGRAFRGGGAGSPGHAGFRGGPTPGADRRRPAPGQGQGPSPNDQRQNEPWSQ